MKAVIFILIFILSLGFGLSNKLHSIKGPIKAIYIDWENVNWNNPEQTVLAASDAGFNVIILAFYLSSGVTDFGQAWEGVPAATKRATMSTLHQRGQIALVSFGGSTDNPYTYDPEQMGQTVANWALSNQLDGVDFDLENFQFGFTVSGLNADETVQWVSHISNSARQVLGDSRYVTHAPQAPYFGPPSGSSSFAGKRGGYSSVYLNSENIDWFHMQFYNQGSDCYTSYSGIFSNSCSDFPGTSVSQIVKYGIPMSKIVVGKPVQENEASNGYNTPEQLHGWFENAAKDYSWRTGVMGWEWAETAILNHWISTIYPNSTLSQ